MKSTSQRHLIYWLVLRVCSWVLFGLGIVWVFLHPAITITTGELKCRGTYISENELLVGGAEPTCSSHQAQIAKQLHTSFLAIPELPAHGCRDNCSNVLDWIDAQLATTVNVETYRHTFTTRHGGGRRATNAYAILRAAPLTDGKESVLLVAHYRNLGTLRKKDQYSGLSMGIALVQFLANAKWLAKDVILLLADDGDHDGHNGFSPGTEAWLRGYHLDPFDQANENSLTMHAGVIRAALHLDTFHGTFPAGAIGIFTAGVNGQLPNLDLINTAVEAFHNEQIQVVLDNCRHVATPCRGDLVDWVQRPATLVANFLFGVYKGRDYSHNLQGMLRFMKNLVVGPSGTHASFVSYNIDSITLSPLETVNPTTLSLVGILRATESIVRSVSNTEEKFHQSFFLYLLPNTQTFVSIGEYYYALALVLCPVSIHLIHLSKNTTGKRIAFGLLCFILVELFGLVLFKLATSPVVDQTLESLASGSTLRLYRNVVGAMTMLGIALAEVICAMGLVPAINALTCTKGCSQQGEWQQHMNKCQERILKEQNQAQHSGLTPAPNASPSVPANSPPGLKDQSSNATNNPCPEDNSDPGWKALKCIMLALIVFAHFPLGIINYPLALVGALSTAWSTLAWPLATCVGTTRLVFAVVLLVSSPFVVLLLLQLVHSDTVWGSALFLTRGFTEMTLLTLPYLCCVYFPVHTLALAIATWSPPSPSSVANLSNKSRTCKLQDT